MDKKLLEQFKQKEKDYTNSYLMAIVSKEYKKAIQIKTMIQETQIAFDKLTALNELKLEDLKIDFKGIDE